MKIVFMSDLHVGSAFAPLPNGFSYRSGDNLVRPRSVYSDFVTRLFYDTLEEVGKYARGCTLVVLGDVVNGVKHTDDNIITRVGDQIDAARALLEDTVRILDARHVVLVDGTEAHDGEVGNAIASALNADVIGHGLLDVGGAKVDVAHHGGAISNAPHVNANTFRAHVAQYIITCVANGLSAPDVVARAHVHRYAAEYVTIGQRCVVALVTPAWCGLTPYARRVTRSTPLVSHGVIVYDTETHAARPFVHVFDTRTTLKVEG